MDVIETIWKKPYYHDRNQRMIEAGINCFRVKCSHWGLEDIATALQNARNQLDESGKRVKLLADLPEAKIRLGHFPQEKILLKAGTSLHFKYAEESADPFEFVPMTLEGFGNNLRVNDIFYTGDGQVAYRVDTVVDPNHVIVTTENAGVLNFHTAVTIPHAADQLNHVTPFVKEIINILPQCRPEMVAFSFVNSGDMAKELVGMLQKVTTTNWNPQIIAKIESPKGIEHIDQILDHVGGIMVARGDLGLLVPYAKLGKVQKYLIRKAHEKKKYVIVATQILQSLLDNHIPMRSDILDLTNICLDGADAVMLCAETAHSTTPERAVTVAKEIIREMETPGLSVMK